MLFPLLESAIFFTLSLNPLVVVMKWLNPFEEPEKIFELSGKANSINFTDFLNMNILTKKLYL